MVTGFDKKWVRVLIGTSPIGLVCIYGLLLYLPFTREFALSLRGEKGLIEITTFLFLFAAGLYGLYVTQQVHKARVGKWITGFYLLFSLGALLTAMEEVAWGQWFLGIDHPKAIHNLAPFQGHTEYVRVFFGVAGLVGIYMNRWHAFKLIAPSLLLLPWFMMITAHAIPDLYIDFYPDNTHAGAIITKDSALGWYIETFAEFVEMMIGMTAFIYIRENHLRYFSTKLDNE